MTTDKQQAPKLLDMRVASFTHFLQGPAASQYLADMGADVIKVEAPGGNYERRWLAAGRDVGGYGSLLLAANRNLRSIVIDLKGDLGREAALKLIENSDVVIEAYRFPPKSRPAPHPSPAMQRATGSGAFFAITCFGNHIKKLTY